MAKRSTIGENPLDAVMSANPLDTVVPDLTLVPKAGRLVGTPELEKLQERLAAAEAKTAEAAEALLKMRSAQEQTAPLAGAVAALKGEVATLKAALQRLESAAPGMTAELSRLATEASKLKEELGQLKAALAGPRDVPWWMGGRRR